MSGEETMIIQTDEYIIRATRRVLDAASNILRERQAEAERANARAEEAHREFMRLYREVRKSPYGEAILKVDENGKWA
jgi:hypothetical protein